MKLVSAIVISLFVLVSCGKEKNSETNKEKNEVSKNHTPYGSTLPMKIYLQPYGNFTKKEAEFIKQGLEKTYLSEVYINTPKDFPKNSFNGKRYRADIIIKSLSDLKQEKGYKSVIVGLIHKDISTTYKEHQDWGVIGLAYIGGVSCVTSTYRLQNREQHLLATIHEIGHNVGLPHCDENGCIMQDAKGKNIFKKHRTFGQSCAKKALKNKVIVK